MLARLICVILLSFATCLCSTVTPRDDRDAATRNRGTIAALWDRGSGWQKGGQQNGFLRMPMARKTVNGTGRRGRHDKGRGDHGSTAVSKRGWGWSHIEDVGGIIYIIQSESRSFRLAQARQARVKCGY